MAQTNKYAKHIARGAAEFKRVYKLTIKRAIEELGDKAIDAIEKEIGQLYARGTFARANVHDMTAAIRRTIISSSCFLKEKFNAEGLFDKLKARLVAGGHRQDRSVYKSPIDSPTVSTTAVFLVAGIAAKEGRATATVDFPGAYLHADLRAEDGPPVLMRLNRYETSVLVKMAKEFEKDVDKRTGTLTVQLKKGLYGLIQSARLWYEKLSGDLRDLGFEANKSDECVFNRTEADGSQTTLVLHVDDVLVTAKTTADVKRFLSDIGKKYSDLTIHEGPELDYLGMHLSWSTRGKCAVTMPGYIDEVLDFASRITGESKTPAGNNLFEIDEASPLLEKGDAEYYHSLTAKLLYLAKRARPDILLAVSFLARRVQAPTQQDNKKLGRVVQYLRKSAHLGMCLEASKDKPLQAYAWIDASFAVHSDMRSHTGVVLGIGKGPAYCKSSVQKLNTTSSTHAEIVGVSDGIGQLLWTKEFLEHQKLEVRESAGDDRELHKSFDDDAEAEATAASSQPGAVLYQDNLSAKTLLETGKRSSRTRHIAVRYFFIKDQVLKRQIEIKYCPTEDMVADILTKPLQGADFIRLRAELLNWPADEIEAEVSSSKRAKRGSSS
jgi:hypothetical protein